MFFLGPCRFFSSPLSFRNPPNSVLRRLKFAPKQFLSYSGAAFLHRPVAKKERACLSHISKDVAPKRCNSCISTHQWHSTHKWDPNSQVAFISTPGWPIFGGQSQLAPNVIVCCENLLLQWKSVGCANNFKNERSSHFGVWWNFLCVFAFPACLALSPPPSLGGAEPGGKATPPSAALSNPIAGGPVSGEVLCVPGPRAHKPDICCVKTLVCSQKAHNLSDFHDPDFLMIF